MIRDDHERAIRTQVFVPDNFETIVNTEQTTDDQRAERAQSVNEHVGLTRKLAKSLERRLIKIAGGIVTPSFHFSA